MSVQLVLILAIVVFIIGILVLITDKQFIVGGIILLILCCIFFFYLYYHFLAPKTIRQHWQEEVLLSSGAILWIDREVKFVAKPEPFTLEKGVINDMIVSIKLPENIIAPFPPPWRFNAVPILLDYDDEKKTWIILASYFYCSSWRDAGSPTLSTWQYIVKNNQWVVVPLDPKYVGRRANLSATFTNQSEKLEKVTQKEISRSTQYSKSVYDVINGVETVTNCSYSNK